jgi:hypothetical protein
LALITGNQEPGKRQEWRTDAGSVHPNSAAKADSEVCVTQGPFPGIFPRSEAILLAEVFAPELSPAGLFAKSAFNPAGAQRICIESAYGEQLFGCDNPVPVPVRRSGFEPRELPDIT